MLLASAGAATSACSAPLTIAKQGAFAVGGKVIGDAEKSSLHCDHGVVEFQIPPRARGVNLLRDAGLTGNTHLPFADLNNVAVADLLSKYLHAHGLDIRSR